MSNTHTHTHTHFIYICRTYTFPNNLLFAQHFYGLVEPPSSVLANSDCSCFSGSLLLLCVCVCLFFIVKLLIYYCIKYNVAFVFYCISSGISVLFYKFCICNCFLICPLICLTLPFILWKQMYIKYFCLLYTSRCV